MKNTNILGISAYYHDSAACLVQNGKIVAAAQEERFTRKKHDHEFPVNAIDYCLDHAGIQGSEGLTGFDLLISVVERSVSQMIMKQATTRRQLLEQLDDIRSRHLVEHAKSKTKRDALYHQGILSIMIVVT